MCNKNRPIRLFSFISLALENKGEAIFQDVII
jgi:hypothetical protein